MLFRSEQDSWTNAYLDYLPLIADGMDYTRLKKLFVQNHVSKFIKLNLSMPFTSLYPDADPKLAKSKNGSIRHVRVMQLQDVNMDPEDIFLDKKEEEEEEEDDEEMDQVVLDVGIKNRVDRSLIATGKLLEDLRRSFTHST